MNRARFPCLEVLSQAPVGEPRATPLVFIHGAYAGAWCWAEHFLPWFAEQGYACYALSLSGHGNSEGRAYLDTFGIDRYVADVLTVVGDIEANPVLIGHSMGGMVVQKYMEKARPAGAVLMASVPPQGLTASAVGLALRRPALLADLNRLLGGARLPFDSLRDALFSQPISAARLQRYYEMLQPESLRAIWDMTLFNLPRLALMSEAPMLVLGAEHDQLIPESVVRSTASTYGAQAQIFPDMGHGMMLEQDWRTVARSIRLWLAEQGF